VFQDCIQVPTDGKRSSNISGKNFGIYDGTLTELNPPISFEIKGSMLQNSLSAENFSEELNFQLVDKSPPQNNILK
jgi:hypothetical protein